MNKTFAYALLFNIVQNVVAYCAIKGVTLVSVLEATLETRCRDAKLNCDHGCRWKHGETDVVECFCNEGFTLDQDGRACNGNFVTYYH